MFRRRKPKPLTAREVVDRRLGTNPTIMLWRTSDGTWYARSSDPRQGGIGGTKGIALGAAVDWLEGDR
jgi:hypothetical protein